MNGMFVVVLCPRCDNLNVAQLIQSTKTCAYCSGQINVDNNTVGRVLPSFEKAKKQIVELRVKDRQHRSADPNFRAWYRRSE